jgi:hypothetical protein
MPVLVVIVNVYDVPLDSPVTMIGLDEPVAVIPLGEDVTVYVTDPFPLYAGSVNATVTCPLPAVTPVTVGDPGTLPDCAAVLPIMGIWYPYLV